MANPPTADNAKKIGRAGRKRRFTGWTLLLLGLLVAAVWLASGWRSFGLFHHAASQRFLMIERGSLSSWPTHADLSISWGFPPEQSRWRLWMARHASGYSGRAVYSYPLWPIPLLLWTPAALLLRSGDLARRRAMIGMCTKGGCGYSLAGLGADAKCPECGTVRSGAERMNAGSEAVRSNGPLHNSDGGTK